jgi:hypothetical protein
MGFVGCVSFNNFSFGTQDDVNKLQCFRDGMAGLFDDSKLGIMVYRFAFRMPS